MDNLNANLAVCNEECKILLKEFSKKIKHSDTDILECTLYEYYKTLMDYWSMLPLLSSMEINQLVCFQDNEESKKLNQHIKLVRIDLDKELRRLVGSGDEYESLCDEISCLNKFYFIIRQSIYMPNSYFGEKAHQVKYTSLSSFGIPIESRHDKANEICEMINFTMLLAQYNVEHLVKEVFYDSSACLCTFTLCDSVEEFGVAHRLIDEAASKTIAQFQLFNSIGHGPFNFGLYE